MDQVERIVEVTIRVIDYKQVNPGPETANTGRIWYTFTNRGICDALAVDEVNMGILTRTIGPVLVRINVIVVHRIFDSFTKYHNAKELCKHAITEWQSTGAHGL